MIAIAWLIGFAIGLCTMWWLRRTQTHRLSRNEVNRIATETLRAMWSSAAATRAGLTTAGDLASHLRTLLRASGLSITDKDGAELDRDGATHHDVDVAMHLMDTVGTRNVHILSHDQMTCEKPDCVVRYAISAPLMAGGDVQAVLTAFVETVSGGVARSVSSVAQSLSDQLELAELDKYKVRLAEAELRAHRAQIAPHFVYNAMTTIAALVRTDPEQARELLIDFADFTRYSFSRHGQFTTLAEELQSIEHYLTLQQARFGRRLSVTVRVSHDVLPLVMPFLCMQPLVENAIQHGMTGDRRTCHVTIVAEDGGPEVWISVEDDGAGMDPHKCLDSVLDTTSGQGIGLRNINERMRQVYGDEYALVVDTEVGAGTKVWMRVPKYHPGVHRV